MRYNTLAQRNKRVLQKYTKKANKVIKVTNEQPALSISAIMSKMVWARNGKKRA